MRGGPLRDVALKPQPEPVTTRTGGYPLVLNNRGCCGSHTCGAHEELLDRAGVQCQFDCPTPLFTTPRG